MCSDPQKTISEIECLILQVKNSDMKLSTLHKSLQSLQRIIAAKNDAVKQRFVSTKTAISFLILAVGFKLWISCFSNLHEKECLIDMPIDNRDVFRPPVDCSMCRHVDQVDVVANLTKEEFATKYAYSGRPAVITDALVNWTARSVFNFDFFRNLYNTYGEGDSLDRCQFFRYKTEFKSLTEALNMSEDRKKQPWYFGWSNCQSEAADVLRQHYGRPYFLPEDSESSKTDWIFIGTAGLGAHMHVDHVGLPSWQAQISGRKKWILEPPPECFYQCTPMEVVVNAGDTIVLNTNIWYHKTSVVSDQVSVTIGSEYD